MDFPVPHRIRPLKLYSFVIIVTWCEEVFTKRKTQMIFGRMLVTKPIDFHCMDKKLRISYFIFYRTKVIQILNNMRGSNWCFFWVNYPSKIKDFSGPVNRVWRINISGLLTHWNQNGFVNVSKTFVTVWYQCPDAFWEISLVQTRFKHWG